MTHDAARFPGHDVLTKVTPGELTPVDGAEPIMPEPGIEEANGAAGLVVAAQVR